MIDTHIHLYDSQFDGDLEAVVKRAKDAGVDKCIIPGVDSKCLGRLLDCASAYPDFAYPAVGLHPTSVDASWQTELLSVKDALLKRKFYAIGEIGLDCFWSKDFLEQQKVVFKEQIILALGADLPIIIHSRDAWVEMFEVFDEFAQDGVRLPRGVFHAFSGSFEIYERIRGYGDFKLGIGGVVTYKNAGIAKVLEEIPLSDIVLETDAPYLTPAAFRGKRNESSYLYLIAEKIAEVKGSNVEEVANVTTANAINLFGLI